jgi:hypothetical protein
MFNMPKSLILIAFLLIIAPTLVGAQLLPHEEDHATFSGRISRINTQGRLMRIKTDFTNIKFLNRKDRVEFWNESYPGQRCISVVEGRTNDYILLKVPQFEACIRKVHFTTGTFLHFHSQDLQQTVKIAKELVEILLKKRLAINAKKQRHQKELDTYMERVDAVNKRYEILRQKLEIEWQKELAAMEDDKIQAMSELKSSEARLSEIDTKLETYRVDDHNLKVDRWSLDPALFIQK